MDPTKSNLASYHQSLQTLFSQTEKNLLALASDKSIPIPHYSPPPNTTNYTSSPAYSVSAPPLPLLSYTTPKPYSTEEFKESLNPSSSLSSPLSSFHSSDYSVESLQLLISSLKTHFHAQLDTLHSTLTSHIKRYISHLVEHLNESLEESEERVLHSCELAIQQYQLLEFEHRKSNNTELNYISNKVENEEKSSREKREEIEKRMRLIETQIYDLKHKLPTVIYGTGTNNNLISNLTQNDISELRTDITLLNEKLITDNLNNKRVLEENNLNYNTQLLEIKRIIEYIIGREEKVLEDKEKESETLNKKIKYISKECISGELQDIMHLIGEIKLEIKGIQDKEGNNQYLQHLQGVNSKYISGEDLITLENKLLNEINKITSSVQLHEERIMQLNNNNNNNNSTNNNNKYNNDNVIVEKVEKIVEERWKERWKEQQMEIEKLKIMVMNNNNNNNNNTNTTTSTNNKPNENDNDWDDDDPTTNTDSNPSAAIANLQEQIQQTTADTCKLQELVNNNMNKINSQIKEIKLNIEQNNNNSNNNNNTEKIELSLQALKSTVDDKLNTETYRTEYAILQNKIDELRELISENKGNTTTTNNNNNNNEVMDKYKSIQLQYTEIQNKYNHLEQSLTKNSNSIENITSNINNINITKLQSELESKLNTHSTTISANIKNITSENEKQNKLLEERLINRITSRATTNVDVIRVENVESKNEELEEKINKLMNENTKLNGLLNKNNNEIAEIKLKLNNSTQLTATPALTPIPSLSSVNTRTLPSAAITPTHPLSSSSSTASPPATVTSGTSITATNPAIAAIARLSEGFICNKWYSTGPADQVLLFYAIKNNNDTCGNLYWNKDLTYNQQNIHTLSLSSLLEFSTGHYSRIWQKRKNECNSKQCVSIWSVERGIEIEFKKNEEREEFVKCLREIMREKGLEDRYQFHEEKDEVKEEEQAKSEKIPKKEKVKRVNFKEENDVRVVEEESDRSESDEDEIDEVIINNEFDDDDDQENDDRDDLLREEAERKSRLEKEEVAKAEEEWKLAEEIMAAAERKRKAEREREEVAAVEAERLAKAKEEEEKKKARKESEKVREKEREAAIAAAPLAAKQAEEKRVAEEKEREQKVEAGLAEQKKEEERIIAMEKLKEEEKAAELKSQIHLSPAAVPVTDRVGEEIKESVEEDWDDYEEDEVTLESKPAPLPTLLTKPDVQVSPPKTQPAAQSNQAMISIDSDEDDDSDSESDDEKEDKGSGNSIERKKEEQLETKPNSIVQTDSEVLNKAKQENAEVSRPPTQTQKADISDDNDDDEEEEEVKPKVSGLSPLPPLSSSALGRLPALSAAKLPNRSFAPSFSSSLISNKPGSTSLSSTFTANPLAAASGSQRKSSLSTLLTGGQDDDEESDQEIEEEVEEEISEEPQEPVETQAAAATPLVKTELSSAIPSSASLTSATPIPTSSEPTVKASYNPSHYPFPVLLPIPTASSDEGLAVKRISSAALTASLSPQSQPAPATTVIPISPINEPGNKEPPPLLSSVQKLSVAESSPSTTTATASVPAKRAERDSFDSELDDLDLDLDVDASEFFDEEDGEGGNKMESDFYID